MYVDGVKDGTRTRAHCPPSPHFALRASRWHGHIKHIALPLSLLSNYPYLVPHNIDFLQVHDKIFANYQINITNDDTRN